MLWEEDYPKLLDLLDHGFDLETTFTLWCHSSHGVQTHTLLSYCGELEGMHTNFSFLRQSDRPFAACQWVRTLLELGARVDTAAVTATLYHCRTCLEVVLDAGADVNARICFQEFGRPSIELSGLDRSRSGCYETIQVFVDHGADYIAGVPPSDQKDRYNSYCAKVDEFFAFELPLRQDNCRAAIYTFLGAMKYYHGHWIDRNVALAIAKLVWLSNASDIWSFHEHMVLTESWTTFT
jgi:hypothetical protein